MLYEISALALSKSYCECLSISDVGNAEYICKGYSNAMILFRFGMLFVNAYVRWSRQLVWTILKVTFIFVALNVFIFRTFFSVIILFFSRLANYFIIVLFL